MVNQLRRILKWGAIGSGVLFVVGYGVAYWLIANLSLVNHGSVNLTKGNIKVPSERKREWAESSELLESVVNDLATKYEKDLSFGNKEVDGVLAQLAAGRNLAEANRILQEAQPWGEVGTGHDYDFTLCGLTLILYAFGERPDVLYPETVEHLVENLLTAKGGEPAEYPLLRRYPVLKLLPLKDTENHILMTEGSRFLTNQWIAKRGSKEERYDNGENGLEAYLLGHLAGMERAGVHEYNSIPYEGYTLRALVNLASFAEGPVGGSARRILNRMTWTYALGSLSLRRCAPFRRHPKRAGETDLDAHYQTAMMKGWMSLAGLEGLEIRKVPQHALWVPLTSYRPPDEVVEWVAKKRADYFVQIGHGEDGSPEIYSGGPGYLISAGGVARSDLGDSVARPTTLMLEDGAENLEELLRVSGPGEDYREWNNTGVHRRLAVGAGPVLVPEGWEPALEWLGWSFFERAGQRIAVFSRSDFGLFCVMSPEAEWVVAAKEMAETNSEAERLKREFRWPGGSVVGYEVGAPRDIWVVESLDGRELNRDHGRWPLMKGRVPQGLNGQSSREAGAKADG